MAQQAYRFVPGSLPHRWFLHYDNNPGGIAGRIEGLRRSYREERDPAERARIARLGESYQQLHAKHFGHRY